CSSDLEILKFSVNKCIMFFKLKVNRLNNRDFNIDQNNRDYDFFHNRAALAHTHTHTRVRGSLQEQALRLVREGHGLMVISPSLWVCAHTHTHTYTHTHTPDTLR